MSSSELWTPESFYEKAPKCSLENSDLKKNLDVFVEAHIAEGRPIVCVTSGGSTVPLERQCVRFIDNFSRGTRGALSVEQFIENGYAVIFLSRTGSCQPFIAGFQEQLTIHSLVDLFELDNDCVSVRPASVQGLHDAVSKTKDIFSRGVYIDVPYTTLFEYLVYLKMIALALSKAKGLALFYLAAAVSDFFLPWEEMQEHKIQSSAGPLHLYLQRTPKLLGVLRHSWCPSAMVISFKLETDQSLLISKAQKAIDMYGVHLVVANMLETRKDTVYLVTSDTVSRIDRQREEKVIERPLVTALIDLHSQFRQNIYNSVQ